MHYSRQIVGRDGTFIFRHQNEKRIIQRFFQQFEQGICAAAFMFCAWRMRKMRRSLSPGYTAHSDRMRRAVSTLISASPASMRWLYRNDNFARPFGRRHTVRTAFLPVLSHSSAIVSTRAAVSLPMPFGPVSKMLCGKRPCRAYCQAAFNSSFSSKLANVMTVPPFLKNHRPRRWMQYQYTIRPAEIQCELAESTLPDTQAARRADTV